ncbi:MFS transporter [Spirochaeta isovalerica]|uniref:MFS family permease n=1 Tax=Spirochaeta isovalerica TaxID=150 RepID=A0A841R520_9SPIO|nr:MFS transporter [Spirochaeta isovalerica]MBB6478965.1 MFS family permease [Spirochaeta isovalerica]
MLFNTYKGLPRSVYILFLARIVNRLGDFVKLFLTLYLTRYLGMNEAQTGTIITLIGIFSVLGTMLGGKITDHGDRKIILIISQGLSASIAAICGFMPDSPMLPYVLILFNFFNGAARPVNSAMLTDLTTPENRGKAFSLLYLGINIGVSVGPLLAGFLFNNFRQWIFWGDSLTTFLSIILIILFVPSIRKENIVVYSEKEKAEKGHIFSAILKRPVLLIYTLLIPLTSFIYSQHSFSLPLLLEARLNDDGARFFGIIMSVNAVTVLILTPLLTSVLHKVKPLINMSMGQLCYAIGFGMLYLAIDNPVFYLLSTVIWTLGEILNVINSGVFVANHTPVNYRGRFSAWFATARTIGHTSGPLISGLILNSYGMPVIWITSFIIGLALFFSYRYLDVFDSKK